MMCSTRAMYMKNKDMKKKVKVFSLIFGDSGRKLVYTVNLKKDVAIVVQLLYKDEIMRILLTALLIKSQTYRATYTIKPGKYLV